MLFVHFRICLKEYLHIYDLSFLVTFSSFNTYTLAGFLLTQKWHVKFKEMTQHQGIIMWGYRLGIGWNNNHWKIPYICMWHTVFKILCMPFFIGQSYLITTSVLNYMLSKLYVCFMKVSADIKEVVYNSSCLPILYNHNSKTIIL